MIERHVGEAAGEEHRKDAVFANRFMQCGDEMVFRDGALLEVLLHQFVFPFGDQLDESFVAGFGVGRVRSRNFSRDFAAAIASGRVGVGLHRDEIDHAVKAVGVGDGQLDGNTIAAPALVQIVDEGAQAASSAGFGVVHLIDENDARDVGFLGIAPDALGDGLDAVLGVDDDDGGLGGK